MVGEIAEAVRQDTNLRQAFSHLAEVLTRRSLPPPRLAADVFETPDGTAYVVEVVAPWLTADELTVTASGDMLSLEIQPRTSASVEGRTYLVQEVSREPMARVFTFPTAIDVDNVEARLEQGILRIRVPKAEGAPSRIIKVQG